MTVVTTITTVRLTKKAMRAGAIKVNSASRLLLRNRRRRELKRALFADAAYLERKADRLDRSGEQSLLADVNAESKARSILLRAHAADMRSRVDDLVDSFLDELDERASELSGQNDARIDNDAAGGSHTS